MPTISKEEIKKIAEISMIKFDESEITKIAQRIIEVLNYAERVKEVAQKGMDIEYGLTNVVREDHAIMSDAQKILSSSPETENNYFVVPKILEERT